MEFYILLALKIAVGLIVFAVGLNTAMSDATYLFHRPKLLMKSLLSMNIIMPLIALAMIFLFDLSKPVKMALFALSVAPIPPLLPNKALKAGGKITYTVSLLFIMASLSIIFIPLVVELMGQILGRDVQVPPMVIIKVIAATVLVPLIIGFIIHQYAPAIAQKIKKSVSITAMILLVLGILPLLYAAFPHIIAIVGNYTLISIILFILAGLVTGHLLGGPVPENRTVLALTTSTRHPGIAMVISLTIMPEEKLAVVAVILYVLLNVIISIPYMKWRKKLNAVKPGDSE